MTKYFLTLAILLALGWTFAAAPMPAPVPRPVASRATAPDSAVAAPVIAALSSLEARQPPVPLVRSVRKVPVAAASPEVSMPDAEAQARDDFDERAAKSAIEADGYKRVSVLGRNVDGTWRAKAYRGTTDVRLTVDGAGRVSAD